jgi:hypothetical protein
MSTSNFAQDLCCQHCGETHGTPNWPVNGDKKPFYFEDEPGEHSLSVACPHCGKQWFVVWDVYPGPIEPLTGSASSETLVERMTRTGESPDELLAAVLTQIQQDSTPGEIREAQAREKTSDDEQTEKSGVLHEKAKDLVRAAECLAISSLVPICDAIPSIRKVDTEKWDFFVSVASVFIAASRLRTLPGDGDEKSVMESVSNLLADWSDSGCAAFQDCQEFYAYEHACLLDHGHPQEFISSDAVGKWIVMNVFDGSAKGGLFARRRRRERAKIVRAIGTLVVGTFAGWWE